MAVVEVKVEQGLRVKVTTNKAQGGEFIGSITYVNDHEAWVMPDSKDIQKFLGGRGYYRVGKAHWKTSLVAI